VQLVNKNRVFLSITEAHDKLRLELV